MLNVRKLSGLASVALVTGVLGTAASAAVMDFDGFTGNNVGYWEENNFLFNPAKSNNDVKCYDNKCLMEIGQGEVTTMTYDTPAADDGAAGNAALGAGKTGAELAAVYDDVFNLNFFYFLLVGNGDAQENSFSVTGTYADTSKGTVSAEFVLDASITSTIPTGASVSFATDEDSNSNNTDNGKIQKNVGYWVDLDSTYWSALTSVTWTANTFDGPGNKVASAQMRLDCVGANESGTGANSSCAPTTTVVPLPAAAWLLLGGLGALGVAARRRKDGVMV